MRNATLSSLLVVIAKNHRNKVGSQLRDIGLFVGQDILISFLSENGPVAQRVAATELLVEEATISEMVKKLISAGLVDRQRDPDDGRSVQIFLSPDGKRKAKSIDKIWTDTEKAMFGALSDREQEKLTALLTKVSLVQYS